MIIASLATNIANMQIAISEALTVYPKYKSYCSRDDYIVVINMREPSYRKRLALVDLPTNAVTRYHHVAHGIGSSNDDNPALADKFSNQIDTHQTSLGAMVTTNTYHGKHGYSLRLSGLEKGVNDNVGRRCIVFHSAEYMTNDYIMANNRAGQSWGCPAVDPAICNALIQNTQGGCFVYFYY